MMQLYTGRSPPPDHALSLADQTLISFYQHSHTRLTDIYTKITLFVFQNLSITFALIRLGFAITVSAYSGANAASLLANSYYYLTSQKAA